MCICLGTNPDLSREVLAQRRKGRKSMVGKLTKIQQHDIMGGLYLGVAVTGVEALVAMALVIAFM